MLASQIPADSQRAFATHFNGANHFFVHNILTHLSHHTILYHTIPYPAFTSDPRGEQAADVGDMSRIVLYVRTYEAKPDQTRPDQMKEGTDLRLRGADGG